jgi:hypothetical protein
LLESFAERVIQAATALKQAEHAEATKHEARARVLSAQQLEKALQKQGADMDAAFQKEMVAKAAEANAREENLAEQLDKRNQELEKLQKAKAKMDKALNKSQAANKLADMKAEKDGQQLAQLQKVQDGKAEMLMARLFTELKVPFESGQGPASMLRSLLASHDQAMKRVKGELQAAQTTIDKLTKAAADGNHDILADRNQMEAERNDMASKLAGTEEAHRAAEEEAATLRKEREGVHADAKAAARAEVEALEAEIALMKTAQTELRDTKAQLKEDLHKARAELASCAQSLRLAQSAGRNGGYYFAAARTSSPSPEARSRLDGTQPTSPEQSPSTTPHAGVASPAKAVHHHGGGPVKLTSKAFRSHKQTGAFPGAAHATTGARVAERERAIRAQPVNAPANGRPIHGTKEKKLKRNQKARHPKGGKGKQSRLARRGGEKGRTPVRVQ